MGYGFEVLKERDVVGGGLRNCGCYKCNSYDRVRLVYVYLRDVKKIFSSPADYSILHVAPEYHLSKKMKDAAFREYICGDKFTPGYSYPAHVRNLDLTELPFEANHFDLLISNHVLEHIPNDLDAMKEIYRVLKSGGQAILQVPFSLNSDKTIEDSSIDTNEGREKFFGQYDHVRIYGKDYMDRLRSVGFQVSLLNISADYPKSGLNLKEDIFIIQKP